MSVNKKNSIVSVLAFIALLTLPYTIKLNDAVRYITGSILTIPLYIGIWLVIRKSCSILAGRRRLLLLSLAAGILGSGMLIAGCTLYLYDASGLGDWMTYVKILGFTPFLASAFALLFYYYDEIFTKMEHVSLEKKLRKYLNGDKKFFLTVWAGTFLLWIPGLLAAFPGIYGYDSIYQAEWFMSGNMSSAHPIVHTYLLGGCLKIGLKLFGSYEAGMLIYSIIQMLIMSAIFAYISKITCRLLPCVLQLVIILLYALLPYNALFSFSSTKDVIFAGLFAVLVLKTYMIVRDMDGFFGSRKKQLTYGICVFAMCALRYNGYYAFLLMVPFFIFYCRKYWKKAVFLSLCCILVWNVYIGPVHRMMGLEQDSNASMLSIPAQQLARVLRDNEDELTPEETALIQTYIPGYELYAPRISDYIKDAFAAERFDKNPTEFLKLWITVGLKCPLTYVDAFASETIGYWYPDMIYPDEGAFHPYIEYRNTDIAGDWIKIKRTSFLPGLSQWYEDFAATVNVQKIPLLALLFSPGAAFWVLCIAFCRCIYTKNYAGMLPCILMTGLWGTLMLGPVVLFRYAYPLLLCIPVLLCVSKGDPQKVKTRIV